MFEQSTWSPDGSPVVARTTVVRRGSTVSRVIRRSGHSRSTHQSPAHGAVVGSALIIASNFPAKLARTGRSSVITKARPPSTRTTRPIVASAAAAHPPISGSNPIFSSTPEIYVPDLGCALGFRRGPVTFRYCRSDRWGAGSNRNLEVQICLLYTSPSPRDGLLS